MILDDMRARSIERRERYKTIEVNQMPDRKRIGVRHIEGVISKVLPNDKVRYVLKRKLVDLGGVLETPTAVARDYLKLNKFQASRLRGNTKEVLWNRMNAAPAFPELAIPSRFDDGYYLDIRKAFFAIMHIVGWSVSYKPGSFIMRGRSPIDFPFPEEATARNSLVTCSTTREIYAIDPPFWRPIRISHYNPYLNTSLNVIIRDLLHTLAFYAEKAGAVYAHTDGFIAPNYKTAKAIGGIIEDFGLAFSVKGRGSGRVWSLGTYQIGRAKTKWVGLRNESEIHRIRETTDEKWLRYRMESLAANDGALNLRSDTL
jgi:hypothetical protein